MMRFDLGGPLRDGDFRTKNPRHIIIHRNTASNHWFREHPEDVGVKSHLEALASFHSQGKYKFRLFPYHFFIDDDIYQIHPYNVISPHAAGKNNISIGVALNVDGRRHEPSESMYKMAAIVCSRIMVAFPGISIIPHSIEKACPGPKVSVSRIAKMAKDIKDAGN